MSEIDLKELQGSELEDRVYMCQDKDERRMLITEMRRRIGHQFITRKFGERYRDCCFTNAIDTQAVRVAREYVKEKENTLLVLKGNPGVGKSYAARCILYWYVRRYWRTQNYEPPVVYTGASFRRAFCVPVPFDDQWRVTEEWNKFLNAPVVLIDDLGVERVTDAFAERFEEAFDLLHDKKSRLIITTNTNFPFPEDGVRVYTERVESRCRDWAFEGKVHFIQGDDLRKAEEQ